MDSRRYHVKVELLENVIGLPDCRAKCLTVVGAFMAMAQFAGAVTAGLFFAHGDDELLASASTAFTAAVMLVNRWYFRGWRELHQARHRKYSPRTRL